MKRTSSIVALLTLLSFSCLQAEEGAFFVELKGYGGAIRSVAFSPDGKKIATCGDGNVARIWDAESAKELIKLEGHESELFNGGVRSVAFSPDGKKIVTGGCDCTIRIWDSESGKELQKLEGHERWVFAYFSPDGKKIASGSGDGFVRIWDAESGKELKKWKGHRETIGALAFSPDGKKIVTASGDVKDISIIIWDAESGEKLLNLLHALPLNYIAFSPDGKKIAGRGSIWDAESGRLLHRLRGHVGITVYSTVFSPDSKKVATGSDDGTVRIWDAESGEELKMLGVPRRLNKAELMLHGEEQEDGYEGWIFDVAFSQDGKKIVSGGYAPLKIWDWERIERMPPPPVRPAILDF